MNPWTSKGATLYQGDCLDVLPTLEAESVDTVITDPPYFCPATHYQSQAGWDRKFADMSILMHWWGQICDAIKPKLKPSSHLLTFCNADSYAAFYPAMYDRFSKLVCVVWDKDRPGMGRVWRHQHELIIAARNSDAFVPNDGRLRVDVLRWKATLSRDRDHPVEKPHEMLAELIGATTPEGGTVLDPFMGSGTCGTACIQTGRTFVGIEKDPQYFEVAKRRINEGAQLCLEELL